MNNLPASLRWRIIVSDKVKKQLKRNLQLIDKYSNALAKITCAPLGGDADIRPLRGQADLFRCRINGVLRLCYEVQIQKRLIILTDFGHRDDIYKLN